MATGACIDTDTDGIDDNIEVKPNAGGPNVKIDSDGDGTIDALDSDSAGVPDSQEGVGDTDEDGAADYRDADDDGDKKRKKSAPAVVHASIADAGPPPEEGVVEGTGLFCGRSLGGSGGDLGIIVLGALVVLSAARGRRR